MKYVTHVICGAQDGLPKICCVALSRSKNSSPKINDVYSYNFTSILFRHATNKCINENRETIDTPITVI